MLRVYNCPGLTSLPDLPAATELVVNSCPGLTSLPDLPAATELVVDSCAGLTIMNAGKDKRGFQFVAAHLRGAWRIIAGCRNYSPAEALEHWGPGGPSNRPDCLAKVNALIGMIADAEEKS